MMYTRRANGAACGGTGGGNDSDAPTELRMSATAKTYRYLDDDELAAQRSSGARRGRR